jgi:ketosteroid isomerase-like protein
MKLKTLFIVFVFGLAACSAEKDNGDVLRAQVTAVEVSFADTMARRDFEGFTSFLADDAIFLAGGKPLRGKNAVAAHWKHFYEGAQAPFSWKPDVVEVLPSGDLAQSNGPVFAPDGTLIARFYSTWRKRSDGRWEIVFDNGYSVTPSPKGNP